MEYVSTDVFFGQRLRLDYREVAIWRITGRTRECVRLLIIGGIFDRMTKHSFIAGLADENWRFYGTPDGSGLLRHFEPTFGHRWLYLFELIQNALDARAHSVALRLTEDGDALIFQHDGDRPLDEQAVAALSKVFRLDSGRPPRPEAKTGQKGPAQPRAAAITRRSGPVRSIEPCRRGG